ncbi:MAG: addiction module protein [Spirochaetales bacterium]|nr:addiction module protein [Spirochaetales bacterium]
MVTRDEIKTWNFQEKMLVMEELWDEIAREHENDLFPEWHNDILEKRYKKRKNGEEPHYSLDDVRKAFSEK